MKSALSKEQMSELDKRLRLFDNGKMPVSDWTEVYKRLK